MKDRILNGATGVLLAIAATSSAHAEILFRDKFDNHSFDGFTVSGNASDITNSPIRGGNYAAAMRLNRLQDNSSFRTELSLRNPEFEIGREYWIGFSNYLADDWEFGKQDGAIVFQLHKQKDGGKDGNEPSGQPLILSTKLGTWRLQTSHDSSEQSTSNSIETEHFSLGGINKNQWTDWVFHMKLSYGQDGILEAWKNGNKVVSYRGPNCTNDQNGPFMKIGIYNPFWRDNDGASADDRRTIYVDEIRVGDRAASYGDVAF